MAVGAGYALVSAEAVVAQSHSIEIDLQEQVAYLIEDGRAVLASPISSGRERYHTRTGFFRVIEKERRHYSNLYGKIVDFRGNVIESDADADMPLPRGTRFIPAPMHYFIRFNGAEGMHAGHLPGYPASHGCVRLPEANAIAFFNAAEIGTPVTVFGITPRRRARSQQQTMQRRQSIRPQRVDPRWEENWPNPYRWR